MLKKLFFAQLFFTPCKLRGNDQKKTVLEFGLKIVKKITCLTILNQNSNPKKTCFCGQQCYFVFEIIVAANEEKEVLLGKCGQTRLSEMNCLFKESFPNTGHEHSVWSWTKENRGVQLIV